MPKKSETIARSKSKEFKADETAIDEEVATNAQVPEQQPRRSARNAKEATSTVSEKEREKSTGTKKTVKNPKKGSKAKGAKEEDEEEDSAIEEETKKEEEGEPQVGKKIKTNDEKGVEVIEKKTVVEEVKTVVEEDGVKKTKVQQTLTEKTTVEKLLPREFYTRDVVTLSRELLGKIIVRRIGDQVIRARIVEAEAYAGAIDKACHAYQNKKTPKTKPMFREGGHVYVYSIYGNNNCLNITASKEGDPSATLIRAVEIVDGFDLAVANRDAKKLSKTGKELTNGPGKMCAAMKIDKSFNEVDVTQKGDLYIIDDTKSFEVITTKRININYAEEYVHKPWRFCIKDHHCISVKADPCKPEPL